MTGGFRARPAGATAVCLALLSSACVQHNFDQSLADANAGLTGFTDGNLLLARTDEQRELQRRRTAELLAAPLDQRAAVELALHNSPAVHQMLATHHAGAAATASAASMPNPIFSFSSTEGIHVKEIERMLSIGLLDLLSYPQRFNSAKLKLAAGQLQLTADAIDVVTAVRQAWVQAVVARQLEHYAEQVFRSAQASAELAARMQAIGNFNLLDRARQQSFYADATTRLAVARHTSLAQREALSRLLGLSDDQILQLRLPARLPDLPDAPLTAEVVSRSALDSRLDVRIAAADLQSAARGQGLRLLSSATDVEIGASRAAETDHGFTETSRGIELEIAVPLFSNLQQLNASLNARSQAAAKHLEATLRAASSTLREAYSGYRTNYDIARHYRDEVVPLQKKVSEESVLRYNGMLIGVFELLADSRTQIESVAASIDAARQFWLADAALHAAIAGKPAHATVRVNPVSGHTQTAQH